MPEPDSAQPSGSQESTDSSSRPKWTIMVYLAGDNNLTSNSIAILQELEQANHRRDVRVLACFDSNTPRPMGARYVEINHRRYTTHHKIDWGLHNDLVPPDEMDIKPIVQADFCDENPTSTPIPCEPTSALGLKRFLSWSLKYHKADRYMLILFGHGTAVAGNTFLADDNPPSFLRLKDFAGILKEHFPGGANKLDILACDNCVMNGIETAYEIRENVDIMLGSQGLMLTVGWPYKRIINVVERRPSAPSDKIAHRILKACARRLLDFSFMDRSSEQAICDLRTLRRGRGLVPALKDLSHAMQKGLKYDPDTGALYFPPIRDAIWLSRLEAQSYWSETFVDIYDFCELLLKRCNAAIPNELEFVLKNFEEVINRVLIVEPDGRAAAEDKPSADVGQFATSPAFVKFVKERMMNADLFKLFKEIADCCKAVLDHFTDHRKQVVLFSYYVCPELQYSHGLSIYFPWTLPDDPLIFEEVPDRNGHWPARGGATNYLLKTAFDEYTTYAFAKWNAADWSSFLIAYFRATLRNVRRVDQFYQAVTVESDPRFYAAYEGKEGPAPPVNLQKSSSSTGDETQNSGSQVKNYPRRLYVSPADCPRTIGHSRTQAADPHPVSYLGWNIRGIVAEVIGLGTGGDFDDEALLIDDDSETGDGDAS